MVLHRATNVGPTKIAALNPMLAQLPLAIWDGPSRAKDLSYYEPETVYQTMNEFLLMIASPALVHILRNPDTGKIQENILFNVDNGTSEVPANPPVQMCLVRLLQTTRTGQNRANFGDPGTDSAGAQSAGCLPDNMTMLGQRWRMAVRLAYDLG